MKTKSMKISSKRRELIHQKLDLLLNSDFDSDIRTIIGILIAGHGSMFAYKHSMLLEVSLACANAQCTCTECYEVASSN